MKRGLVFSLSALALVLCGSAAKVHAQNVQLSLNLRYTDPADPTEGGQWYLVAKTDDPEGIAGISAYMSNINTAGIAYGANGTNGYPTVTAAQLGAILNGGNPFAGTFGGVVNVVYGQDTAAGPIVADVGQGAGTPGNVATDPLRNPTWNNAAVIANGTFSGARPAFAPSGANVTDANTLSGTTPPANFSQDAVTTTTVRGDALNSLGIEQAGKGLRPGDTNRDGIVNGADFSLLAANFGTGNSWNQGDFNDSGSVNGADFSLLAANFGSSANPGPSVAAVPEPSTVVLSLAAVAAMGLSARRRRS